MTFQSILCAVDFSRHSRGALRYALALARQFGSDLAVLFVNDPLLLAAGASAYGGRRQFVEQTKAELARFVQQSAAARSAPTPEIELLVTAGTPADEILRAAGRLRSDVVVIGTEGLSGIRKVFFGSTTEQVLRRATVPVLAIPAASHPLRSASTPLRITSVIAPIDLAGEWESDAVRACELARGFAAELLLIHVLPPVQTPPWLRTGGDDVERRRIDKATRALERVRGKLFSGVPSKASVVVGNAADEIARLTRRGRSLVVMSLRGTAGVWGAHRGSIAYRVLTHSSTPVLALPRRRIGGRFTARAAKAIDDVLTARDRKEIAGIDALLSGVAKSTRVKP